MHSKELCGCPAKNRGTHAFKHKKQLHRYYILLGIFLALSVIASLGLLFYKNPVPRTSPSFIPVAKRRMVSVVTMLIAATCQSLATVSFQTATNNRIITPSLLGFEALYSAIQTSTIFFFGLQSLMEFKGINAFLIQLMIMIGFSLLLYGGLLSGKHGNVQLMLLVGVVLGTGLKSLSAFMRRLLHPSEFDILQARLFASVNNADVDNFVVAIPLMILAAGLLLLYAKKLNLLSLGREVCVNLGVNHRRGTMYVLFLVSILMSISTALVGPLTFLGFLVATLSYQLTPTYDHRYIFPMALVLGFLILTGSYFLMYHVFNAQGVVSIIIELFGGIAFMALILRKGSL
jgi:iron complex transport system permease protein